MESPIKAEVKANVEVEGRSVDKLVDALVDTFSPATELLGAFGDVVRLGRISVGGVITRRAKQIAAENGLRLVAPPLKFLVPFYEKATLEEASEDDLVEMWARLLVSAGADYSDRHIKYAGILSEIGGIHANIFESLAQMKDKEIALSPKIDLLLFKFNKLDGDFQPHRGWEVVRKAIEQSRFGMRYIDVLSLRENDGRLLVKDTMNPDDLRGIFGRLGYTAKVMDFDNIDLLILESSGLVARQSVSRRVQLRYTVEFEGWNLSDLGRDFYAACGSSNT